MFDRRKCRERKRRPTRTTRTTRTPTRPALLALLLLQAAAVDYASVFRDLLRAPTASALTRATEQWRRSASSASDRALVDGLSAFRKYELERNRKDAERAESLLDRARDSAPSNAWAHYGYALVQAHGPEVQSNGAVLIATGRSWAKEFGLDARAKARRAAERALELDPAVQGAAVILGELSLQTQNPEHLQNARQALERIDAQRRAADTWRALARVLDALDDRMAAVSASQRAVELSPDASTSHAHALALMRVPGREADGAKAYFSAVDRMTRELGDRLYAELVTVATPTDTMRWRNAHLEQRKKFLHNFWEVRAGLAGMPLPERLAEHYRRLHRAVDDYPRQSSGPQKDASITWDTNRLPFDARGQIYVRHGPPEKRTVTPYTGSSACRPLGSFTPTRLGTTTFGNAGRPATGGAPTVERMKLIPPTSGPKAEVWMYRMDDGRPRAYVFVHCGDSPDWIIPYNIPCYLDLPPELFVLQFDITLCGRDTHEVTRVWAREALRTDTHNPKVDRRIPMHMDLLSFRASDGRTELLAPMALGLDSMKAVSAADGSARYSLLARMSVVDTANQRVESSDTTMVFQLSQRLGAGDLINAHAQVRVTPTDHAWLRIVVENANFAGNQARFSDQIRVPSYVGDTLMISDVVLGSAVPGGNLVRGGRRISIMPFAHFAEGRFRLYYEIYNLQGSAPYKTQLLIEPIEAPGAREIRLSFEEEPARDADGVMRVLRTVDSELPRGRYRLWVQIAPTGQRPVQKVREFVVNAGR
jgi:GWxTD domain-containing protein